MSRLILSAVVVVGLVVPVFGQQPVKRTTTTNPDGSKSVVEEFAPVKKNTVQVPTVVRERITTYEMPVVRYSAPAPTVRYVEVPVAVAPVVAAPVYFAVPGRTPVGEYRTGVFGLKKNVVNADGTTTHYGPLGNRR